jgi:hypothetical protein
MDESEKETATVAEIENAIEEENEINREKGIEKGIETETTTTGIAEGSVRKEGETGRRR